MLLEYLEDSNNPAITDDLQLKEIQLKLVDHLHDAQATFKKATNQHRLNSST
jgi:hypothetical protein